MAGDWIKMRGNLWDDPRVAKLCDLTDQGEAAIVGGLYWLWATADQHTEDGSMPGLTLRQIDRKTGIQGFGQALCNVGWLADNPSGVVIQGFEEHNGTSAKRRCTEAQRKANYRNVSASDADKDRTDNGQKAPNLGAREREEKEKREEIQEPTALVPEQLAQGLFDRPDGNGSEPQAIAKPDRIPPCPTAELLEQYHRHLPMLPRVEVMNDGRRRALAARWREVVTDKDLAKTPDPRQAAIEFFDWYFEHAARSAFLTGRAKNWRADFDFLTTPSKFAKVVEGHYHKETA